METLIVAVIGCFLFSILLATSKNILLKNHVAGFLTIFIIALDSVGWEIARDVSLGGDFQSGNRLLAVLIFALLVFYFAMFMRIKLPYPIRNLSSPIALFLVLLPMIGLITAFFNQNELIYIISDTFNLLVILILVVVFVAFADSNGLGRLLTVIALCFLVSDMLLFAERIITGMRMGGPNLFPLVWAFVCMSDLNVKKVSGFPEKLIFLVMVFFPILAIASGSRKSTIEVVILLMLAAPVLLPRLQKHKIVSIGAFLLVGSLLLSAGFVDLLGDTVSKFQSTFQDGEVADASAFERILEASLTVGKVLASDDLFKYLFGFGAGATFFNENAAEGGAGYFLYMQSNFNFHNVHNTYAAVIYRYGFIGLIIFVIFIGYVLRNVGFSNGKQYLGLKASRFLFIYIALFAFIDTYLIYTLADHLVWAMSITIGVLCVVDKSLFQHSADSNSKCNSDI